MFLVKLNEKYGTENVKSFLSTIFRNIKVDRDGDGAIESNEIIDVVLNLSRELFRFKDIVNEFKDLSREEVNTLIEWAEKNFAELTEVREDIELIIVRTFATIHAISLLIESIQALKNGVPAVRYVGELSFVPVADDIFQEQSAPEAKAKVAQKGK